MPPKMSKASAAKVPFNALSLYNMTWAHETLSF